VYALDSLVCPDAQPHDEHPSSRSRDQHRNRPLQFWGAIMEGYSKLASLMGAYPETLIFRCFGAISAQNLLYLQAELVHLEQKLQECAVANERSGDHSEKNLFSKDWFTLAHSSEGSEQWYLVLQIRAKLKEYGSHHKSFTEKFLSGV